MRITRALFSLVILAAAAFAAIAQTAAKVPESKLFDAGKLIEDIRVLSADDMEGRRTEQPAIAKSRDYIKKRFAEVGLKVSEQEFEVRGRGLQTPAKGVNFVATIPGKAKAEKYIVITAITIILGFATARYSMGRMTMPQAQRLYSRSRHISRKISRSIR